MWETAPRDRVVFASDPLFGRGVLHNQIRAVGFSHEGHWGLISSLTLESEILVNRSSSRNAEIPAISPLVSETFRPPSSFCGACD